MGFRGDTGVHMKDQHHRSFQGHGRSQMWGWSSGINYEESPGSPEQGERYHGTGWRLRPRSALAGRTEDVAAADSTPHLRQVFTRHRH